MPVEELRRRVHDDVRAELDRPLQVRRAERVIHYPQRPTLMPPLGTRREVGDGHSDSVGGVVVSNSDEVADQIGFLQNAVGAIMSPFDSWLLLRGAKTPRGRHERHEENGQAMASYLANHAKVHKVNYPGLPDHPQHALAKKQMNGFGAMISF